MLDEGVTIEEDYEVVGAEGGLQDGDFDPSAMTIFGIRRANGPVVIPMNTSCYYQYSV
jgi:hypothetical protein